MSLLNNNAAFQTKHFISLLFSYRFILPVNSFFFYINTFAIPILVQVSIL